MAKKQKKNGGAMSKTASKPNIVLGFWLFAPLILVLGVIPLIVQMHLVSLPASVQAFWTQDSAADFFSYYKSKALLLTVLYMVCVFGYYKAQGLRDSLLQEKALYPYFGAILIFAFFALLSTLFSKYPSIAVWGGPERCEGLLMLLVYLAILLYAMWAYTHKPEWNYILWPLGFLTVVTGILGAFQFFGHDIFLTDFGKRLIIPAVYRAQGELKLLFEYGKIYGTMYHYNYMGSFGAMMVPLFFVLALFLKDRRRQVLCGGLAAIALFALLGSTSRAGIIGLSLTIVCFLIFFGKTLLEHYKITAGCLAVLVILVFGVNMITGGLALARIPSLWNDAKAFVFSGSSDFDYHDAISVHHIDLQNDSATFTFSSDTLTIQKNSNHQPVCTSEDGQ